MVADLLAHQEGQPVDILAAPGVIGPHGVDFVLRQHIGATGRAIQGAQGRQGRRGQIAPRTPECALQLHPQPPPAAPLPPRDAERTSNTWSMYCEAIGFGSKAMIGSASRSRS